MSRDEGRVLALDLGEARVGLALSDPLGIVAQPAGVLLRSGSRRDIERIRDVVAERGVSRVVVGLPLLLSGARGTRADDAARVAEALREAIPDVEVDLWDERMTTVEAERAMIAADVSRKRRRKAVDSLAAVLILQSWLDAHSGGAGPNQSST